MFDLITTPVYWYLAAAAAGGCLMLQAVWPGASGLVARQRAVLGAVIAAWGLFSVISGPSGPLGSALDFGAEILLMLAWFALLYRLLRGPYRQSMPETVRRIFYLFWSLLLAAGLLLGWLVSLGDTGLEGFLDTLVLAAALACVALAAQLKRDAPLEDATAGRHFISAGLLAGGAEAIFHAIRMMAPDFPEELASLRAIPVAFAALLLMRAAQRRPQWSLSIFVSPQVKAYAPRLFGMLGLLAVLVAATPLVRVLPHTASTPVAVGLILAIALPVFLLLFSENLSARLRVFVSKHFLPFRYDYREEWLRLIDTLAAPDQRLPLPERAIKAVAQIVGSPAGVLWLRRNSDDPFEFAANWNTRARLDESVPADDPVLEFMRQRQWIMDTAELQRDPMLYEGLRRPPWLERFPEALLVVPLISGEVLIGFMVLFQSSSAFRLTFEEIDLLRTSGRQVAAHLAQYLADQQLLEAQQFEAFNRLTAFVMHDLKNLIAQQSLVVKNASRHKDNPAFFEDAIATIDNSVNRMSRLLRQLKSGEATGPDQRVRLSEALNEAIRRVAGRGSEPVLEASDDELVAMLDRERFVAVIAHILRNAQDATDMDGRIRVTLQAENGRAAICIEDNGCGMEPEFVRSRLFRPFDSTKGSKGMGIGAYQARMFVADAGGALDVSSEPGRGSRFTIRLPLAELVAGS